MNLHKREQSATGSLSPNFAISILVEHGFNDNVKFDMIVKWADAVLRVNDESGDKYKELLGTLKFD